MHLDLAASTPTDASDVPDVPDAIRAAYEPLRDRSDHELLARVADVVCRPRRDPADSFVLHAPLELLARAALLPFVAPGTRELARLRLVALAHGYDAAGPPATTGTVDADTFASVDAAADHLLAGISAGDLDGVDAAAAWLGRSARPAALTTLLGDAVLPSLAAAAHAPIFFAQLPRVAPRGEVAAELLRPLARELTRHPDWRLSWFETPRPVHDGGPGALRAAVAATPHLGVPGSTFIFPLMSHVEQRGVAAELLAGPTAGLGVDAAAPVLLRAAAWSMLDEPPDHAPYGWTHCLTMPLGALAMAAGGADPSVAIAVAATYVVGFRAALAHRPLDEAPPSDPGLDLAAALAGDDPVAAAGAVWHAPGERVGEIVTALATRAATAHDAHHVKYVVACLDAAAWDRPAARLYLAAAASLTAWWTAHGNPDDPLRPV